MKKILSCLAIAILGFTSMSSTFAAPVSNMQITAKAPVKNKEARMMVESDIVKMQKDGVGIVRSLVETYVKKDKTENGNMKWAFDIKDGDNQINVNADIEKYVNVLSYLQGKQEFGAKGTVKLNMAGKRSDYKATPVKDADGYSSYPKIDINLTATITFDVNVKMIGKDIYFTISEFKTDRSGTANEVEEFDESLREIQRYVGNSYKVSGKDSGIENPAQVFKQMEAVFQVLETKSLFEVLSAKGDVYKLQIKKSTLQAINIALGKKKNAGLKDMAFDDKKMELTYQKTVAGGILKAADKKNKKNYMQLASDNGEYAMDMISSESNRRYKSREDVQIQIKRDYVMIKTASVNSYSSSWFDLTWKDKQLNAKITTQTESYDGNDKVSTYEANGALDIWTGNMDLKFLGDSKEYGSLMIKTEANIRSFKFNFATDMGFMGKIGIIGEGSAQSNDGAIEITAPGTFETIK